MKDKMQDEPGYRLCHVQMPNILYYEDNDSHGNPTFSGAGKGVIHMAVDTLFSGRNWNHTMIEETQWSTKTDSGELVGCMGSLDRNESDLALVISDYPTEHYERIDPFAILFEEPLVMISGYNSTNGTVKADILTASLKSFSMSLWLLIFTVLVIISFVRFISCIVFSRREKVSTSFKIVSLLLDQNNLEIRSKSSNTFVASVSIGMFMIITYYCSLMSTEMVIPNDPFMFDSLQKVADHEGTIPLYYSIFNTYRIFKDAPEGSYKKLFWNKYAHLEKTKKIFADLRNSPSLMINLYKAAVGERVAITSSVWGSLTISLSCQLKAAAHRDSLRLLRTVIFPEEVYQKVVVRNARLRDTPFGKYMKRQVGRLVQSGSVAVIKKELSKGFEFGPSMSQDYFRECTQATYKAPDVHVSQVSFTNFGLIWICFAVGMAVATVVFLIELLMSRLPKKPKKMRKTLKIKDLKTQTMNCAERECPCVTYKIQYLNPYIHTCKRSNQA